MLFFLNHIQKKWIWTKCHHICWTTFKFNLYHAHYPHPTPHPIRVFLSFCHFIFWPFEISYTFLSLHFQNNTFLSFPLFLFEFSGIIHYICKYWDIFGWSLDWFTNNGSICFPVQTMANLVFVYVVFFIVIQKMAILGCTIVT